MFGLLLKKELKVFLTSKGNLAVMIFLPILLLVIFGSALGNYMQADYGTFEDGIVFYYNDDADAETLVQFKKIAMEISDATGVVFTEVSDVVNAQERVEASEAYGVITIFSGKFEYFRSTFNEPEDGMLVRNLFVQLANNYADSSVAISKVQRTVLSVPAVDSKGYYTFSSLAFSILFMGLIIGFSVHNEKTLDTIERIKLSRAGVWRMLMAKITTGILCGAMQSVVIFVFSSLVYQISWGKNIGWIFLIFLLLSLYSSVFGGVLGLLCKNKSTCQSIILMVTMLSGYLGGSITPLTLLENTSVMKLIINVSPLYWVNQAVTKLRNNLLDESIVYAVLVLTGLTIVISLVGLIANRGTPRKVVAA